MSERFDFALEHSTIKGRCLITILSEYLKTVKDSEQFSAKKLKEDCIKYSKENDWVKSAVIKRAGTFYGIDDKENSVIWKVYTLAMQYDAQEISKMAISESKVEQIVYNTLMKDEFRNVCLDAICGQLEIEGRILSEIYRIKIIFVNNDEELTTTDRNTIYLVKRGLNHYEKYEKNVSDEKSENVPCSVSYSINLKEINNQRDISSNLQNNLDPKFTTENKPQIDNLKYNILNNKENISKILFDETNANLITNEGITNEHDSNKLLNTPGRANSKKQKQKKNTTKEQKTT